MEAILSRVTQHAVHLAVRSGISITTSYAIKECSKLLKQSPKSKETYELQILQARLDGKIRAIASSIDLIELIAARGNTSLESVLSLTKDLRYGIQQVGTRLEEAAKSEMASKAHSRQENGPNLQLIIEEMQQLLVRIEEAIPLIHLAIVTSGVNLSTKLAGTISPSRLLQASTFLTSADSRFTSAPANRQQVGPTYTVKLYMLFEAHASRPGHESGTRQPTWKEVVHKARIKLWRVTLEELYALPDERGELDACAESNAIPTDTKAGEFAYQLVIVEDQEDDGLYHDSEDCTPFDDVRMAGIRDLVPVHEVSKIFYADTGKLLGIDHDGETSPVLLLKRDVHAEPPRRMLQRTQSVVSFAEECIAYDNQSKINAQLERGSAPPTPAKSSAEQYSSKSAWRIPADLDPEWLAFEVYNDEQAVSQSDEDSVDESSRPSTGKCDTADSGLSNAFNSLNLRTTVSPVTENPLTPNQPTTLRLSPNKRSEPPIKTSLSLLEMLLKLAALQQFRQESHLAIEDELINFFLEDSATAGAGVDKEYRQRLRHHASKRVGFDPYDESPVKRRNEEYIRNAYETSPRGLPGHYELAYDEAYEYEEPIPTLDFAEPSIERVSPSASSPSRGPVLHQQTPSRSSTPDLSNTSEPHSNPVRAESSPSNRTSSKPLTTPASTAQARNASLRALSEPKPKSCSPLHEVTNHEN